MPTIAPFLMFEGRADEAFKFYLSVFPDSELVSLVRHDETAGENTGKVFHAHIRLSGQDVMCIDSATEHAFTFTPALSLYVTCETEAEVDRIFRELAAGGAVLMPLGEYPFSKRFGWASDRFGVSWQVAVRA